MEKEQIQKYRKRYSIFKIIPSQYETAILVALSKFPELKYVRIHFKLISKGNTLYYSTPSPASFAKQPEKRTYYVYILETAAFPESAALLKNLDFEEQEAVIAHELSHVLQFHKRSVAQLLKMFVLSTIPRFKQALERGADLSAIEHGFGKGLYRHAMYLRSIPGYLRKRPDLNKYYLKPSEILAHLK
jgi:hypothetical protein